MQKDIFSFQRPLLLLSCILLAACSSNEPAPVITAIPETGSPSDATLRSAIGEYIAARGAPPNSVYEYIREDLNGDGRDDALVMFDLPYHHWCGWGGCTMLVMQANGAGFSPRGEVTRVRGPVVITHAKTSGWKDISVRASGTNLADRDVVLRFDGRGYPVNPTTEPSAEESIYVVAGRRIFP